MQAVRLVRSYFKSLRNLRSYMGVGKRLVVAVLLSSLVAGFFESTGLLLFLPLLQLIMAISESRSGGDAAGPAEIDDKLEYLTRFFPDASLQELVIITSLALLGSILFKNFMILTSNRLAAALRRTVTINLRASLYKRFHGAELQLFEENETGDLVSVFIQETYRAVMAIDYTIVLVQRACIIFFYLAMMFMISWQLMFFTMGMAVVIGLAVGFVYKQTKKHGEDFVDANMKLNAHAIESFSGVRQIRTTNNLSESFKDFQDINHEQAYIDERQVRAVALLPPIVETMGVVGGILIIGFASVYLLPNGVLDSAALIAFGGFLMRMLPTVSMLYSLRGQLIFMVEGLFEVERWLATPQHPTVPFGTSRFEKLSDSIRFEEISFAYPNGKVALDKISFDVRRGQTVALVGASGSGKSTLATLLLRMRSPSSGKVLVDGVDYWGFSAESWHRRVATVEQDTFLFHATLRENICYGLKDVPDTKIWEVLEMAQLADWVRTLPEGLETIAGERGASLSGGQKQRLAIARALVRDPEILVLDEATSALDSVSERLVQEALDIAQQGRTVLVIAHRLSTIRNADQIIVLEKGAIVEDGSWEELQELGGSFATYVESSQAY